MRQCVRPVCLSSGRRNCIVVVDSRTMHKSTLNRPTTDLPIVYVWRPNIPMGAYHFYVAAQQAVVTEKLECNVPMIGFLNLRRWWHASSMQQHVGGGGHRNTRALSCLLRQHALHAWPAGRVHLRWQPQCRFQPRS